MPEERVLESWPESEAFATWESGATGDARYGNALRGLVREQYRLLPEAHLDALARSVAGRLSPFEAEDFWQTLQDVGRQIAPIAAQVLPVAAPLIGTAIGGPLGGAIGSTVGGLAGQALAGAAGQPRPPAPGAGVPGAVPAPSPLPAGATSATAQLLSLLQNPALLQSLLGQLLGGAGHSSVPVGAQGTPAPFGAFMNALGVLANQAASEAHAGFAGEDTRTIPTYLIGPSGELADPTIPEHRTRALLERLQEGRAAESFRVADGGGVGGWFRQAGMMNGTSGLPPAWVR